MPIWAQSGRRGGYAIDAAHTLPPINFTAAEAAAVAVALGQPGATPLPRAARLALQKLVAAMAGPDADAARALARRVRAIGSPAAPQATVPASIEDAVIESRVVRLAYEDKDGGLTSREVEPMGLVGVDAWWYLAGHCRLRGGTRVFRMDRIRAVEVLDERVERPPPHPPELEGLVLRPNFLE